MDEGEGDAGESEEDAEQGETAEGDTGDCVSALAVVAVFPGVDEEAVDAAESGKEYRRGGAGRFEGLGGERLWG